MLVVANMQTASGVSIMGRTDAVLAGREARRQEKAKKWLGELYSIGDNNKLRQKFFKNNPPSDYHATTNFDNLNSIRHNGDEVSWREVRRQVFQPFSLLKKDSKSYMKTVFTEQERHNADEILTSAIQETGLGALRLPRAVIYDDEAKLRIAAYLVQANKELQRVTGWDGEVLGLRNRVILDMDSPQQTARTKNDSPYIYLRSWSDKIAHEWYHALDIAMGRSGASSVFGTTSDDFLIEKNSPRFGEITDIGDRHRLTRAQHDIWQSISNPYLTPQQRRAIQKEIGSFKVKGDEAWTLVVNSNALAGQKEAASRVVTNGSPWLHWKREMVKKERNENLNHFFNGTEQAAYTSAPKEILAQSFSSTVVHSLPVNQNPALRTRDNDEDGHLIIFHPTATEARAARKAWQHYFSQTKDWWLDDARQRAIVL